MLDRLFFPVITSGTCLVSTAGVEPVQLRAHRGPAPGCDVLVIQAVRWWVDHDPEARGGWIGALRDQIPSWA